VGKWRDRVYFKGVAEDVRPLYRAADVLVHPAWYDPAPNVILESMAMGLPVITSTTCGNQELVAEGESGFVIPATDTARLTQCLQANRPDDWRQMGMAARQVAEQYPLTAMTTELFNLYAKLLEI
jgi:Glycosyltransferase